MEKRLCDLVQLVENNHSCAILEVKPDTKPFDLIRLGGFNGDETMFRVSKDPDTISVTIFREGEKPFSMSYGGSVTLVSENEKTMRRLILECVNLDYGIFTDRPYGGMDFDMLVEETSGERTLDSPRRFDLRRGGADCSLFVNDQHIALIDKDKLETWLGDRNIQMEVINEGRWGDVGYLHRFAKPEQEEQRIPHTVIARFGTTALVFTGLENPEPYVVAQNYNAERGDWSSGSYHTNLAAAWEEAGGEQSHRPSQERPDAVCTIVWSREDIAAGLENLGFEPSDQNIDLFASQASRTLEDVSVMQGWDIIADCINSIEDQLTKPEATKQKERPLDDLAKEAKGRAVARNADHSKSGKDRRTPDMER